MNELSISSILKVIFYWELSI